MCVFPVLAFYSANFACQQYCVHNSPVFPQFFTSSKAQLALAAIHQLYGASHKRFSAETVMSLASAFPAVSNADFWDWVDWRHRIMTDYVFIYPPTYGLSSRAVTGASTSESHAMPSHTSHTSASPTQTQSPTTAAHFGSTTFQSPSHQSYSPAGPSVSGAEYAVPSVPNPALPPRYRYRHHHSLPHLSLPSPTSSVPPSCVVQPSAGSGSRSDHSRRAEIIFLTPETPSSFGHVSGTRKRRRVDLEAESVSSDSQVAAAVVPVHLGEAEVASRRSGSRQREVRPRPTSSSGLKNDVLQTSQHFPASVEDVAQASGAGRGRGDSGRGASTSRGYARPATEEGAKKDLGQVSTRSARLENGVWGEHTG